MLRRKPCSIEGKRRREEGVGDRDVTGALYRMIEAMLPMLHLDTAHPPILMTWTTSAFH